MNTYNTREVIFARDAGYRSAVRLIYAAPRRKAMRFALMASLSKCQRGRQYYDTAGKQPIKRPAGREMSLPILTFNLVNPLQINARNSHR